MSDTQPFWVRRAAQAQPLFSDAQGEPYLVEIDKLLVKGEKAAELSPADVLRLNVLGRVLGFGTTPTELERAFNVRLDRLQGKFPRG